MWFPSPHNKALNALLIPVRLVVLIYWDIRCQWLGKHKYERVYRRDWNYVSVRVYWERDVCVNPWCRVIGHERRVRVRPGEPDPVTGGDGNG